MSHTITLPCSTEDTILLYWMWKLFIIQIVLNIHKAIQCIEISVNKLLYWIEKQIKVIYHGFSSFFTNINCPLLQDISSFKTIWAEPNIFPLYHDPDQTVSECMHIRPLFPPMTWTVKFDPSVCNRSPPNPSVWFCLGQ